MYHYCHLTGMESRLRGAQRGHVSGQDPSTDPSPREWSSSALVVVKGMILCVWPSGTNNSPFLVLSRTLDHPYELSFLEGVEHCPSEFGSRYEQRASIFLSV